MDLEAYLRAKKTQQAGAGASKEEMSRYLAKQYAMDERLRQVEGMSEAERTLAGMGRGMLNTAQNVGDIVGRIPGLGALRPDAQQWQEQAELERPLLDTTAGTVGNLIGETAATLPVGLGAGGAVRAVGGKLLPKAGGYLAKTVLPKAVRAAGQLAEGAAQGYVMAGPGNRGEGAELGATIAGAVPILGKVGSSLYRGLVKPTAAGFALRAKGASGLTLGQLAPHNALAQMEEAGTSVLGMGPYLKAQRDAGRQGWEDVMLKEGLAPGAPPLPEGTLPERLTSAYQGYEGAYGPIKSAPFPADVGGVTTRQAIGEAFEAAAKNPDVLAPEGTRKMVNDFLQNQATTLDRVPITPWPSSPLIAAGARQKGQHLLPANASPSSTGLVPALPAALAQRGIVFPPHSVIPPLRGTIPAEALMAVRGNIRKQISRRLSGTQPDFTSAEMLGTAEQTLSDALDAYLPPGAADTLKAADRQYAKYKTIEDAVARAGDNPVRPSHLSGSVKGSMERGSYARGGGGELRDVAQLGHEVLDARIPMTGARALALPFTSVPGLNVLPSAFAWTANTAPIKPFMLGEYPVQKAVARGEDWLRQHGLIDVLRAGTKGYQTAKRLKKKGDEKED